MLQTNQALIASIVGLLVLLSGCTSEATTTLTAHLSGPSSDPDPGDPDGSGTASITLDEDAAEVCWELMVEDIAPATAAHIHRGEAGEAGPVVVPLSAPEDGASEGCTESEDALIREILASPSGFYVNVHNADYPAGAIRGQLAA